MHKRYTMKIFNIILLALAITAFYGCPSPDTGNSPNVSTADENYKTADEISLSDYEDIEVENTYNLDDDAFSKVSSMANETCLCLKPLEDLKVKLDKGDITPESYQLELQPVIMAVSVCMDNIQTRLATEANKQATEDAMMDVMRKKCPEVAGVMFQGR